MKNRPGNWFFAFFFVVLLAGCGKKGPPVPPGELPPPVSDLKAEVADHTLELTWTVPQDVDRWKHFTVFRSKKELLRPGCKKCPPKFEKVADVPVRDRGMAYREPLEIGYEYIYKVAGSTRDGMESHGSNRVKLVH